MRINGTREIRINKADLVAKIKENKIRHIEQYVMAVGAYKSQALSLLKEQMKALANGSLKVSVNLTSPSNKESEYDKLSAMFEWELADEVVLTQNEFNEYVLDETSFAREARLQNSSYSSLGL